MPDLPDKRREADAGAHAADTAHTQHGHTHQMEAPTNMREMLRRIAGNLASGEGTAGALMPRPEAGQSLTISLTKMTPEDDV